MNILLLGSGGREHAIAFKIAQSTQCKRLFIAPGNAGTAEVGENVVLDISDFDAVGRFVLDRRVEMLVVGPEAPLVAGIADYFHETPELRHVLVIGPSKEGARLEGSKDYAKAFMMRHNIPTARYQTFTRDTLAEAEAFLDTLQPPYVLKADGLAAGKGVSVCMTKEDVDAAIADMFDARKFGAAADSVLVEQYLDGEEASLLAFVDGEHVALLPSAQDHKRLLDGDKGPNTGGMGAYSPAPAMTPDMLAVVESQVFLPVVRELKARGIVYRGVLYAGLMLNANGPKVLEFNCRFGDPETQAVLARLSSPLLEPMRACLDGTLDKVALEIDPRPAVCVVMVAGGYPETYKKGDLIEGLDEAAAQPGVVVFHAGTKPAEGGAVLTDGGRVLGVTALGDGIKDAVAAAYRGVVKIKFADACYRSDIAHRAIERLA